MAIPAMTDEEIVELMQDVYGQLRAYDDERERARLRLEKLLQERELLTLVEEIEALEAMVLEK